MTKLTKKRVAELQSLIPVDAKGVKLEFTGEDLLNLHSLTKVAYKRTNHIALELVLGISLRDALEAAYVQGIHDIIIGYVNNEKS